MILGNYTAARAQSKGGEKVGVLPLPSILCPCHGIGLSCLPKILQGILTGLPPPPLPQSLFTQWSEGSSEPPGQVTVICSEPSTAPVPLGGWRTTGPAGLAPSLPSLPHCLPSPLHYPLPATLASSLSLGASECAPSSEPLCLLGPLPTTRVTGSPWLAGFLSSFNTVSWLRKPLRPGQNRW